MNIQVLCLVIIGCFTSSSLTAYTPVSIVSLWRHGARSAAFNTLNQTYIHEFGKANLLPNGMRMHYSLGAQVRHNYKDSLFSEPSTWNSTVVRTSETERTYLSAVSHLQGLLPVGTGYNITTPTALQYTKPPTPTPDVTFTSDFSIPTGVNTPFITTVPKVQDNFFNAGMKTLCNNQYYATKKIYKKMIADQQPRVQSLADKLEKIYPAKKLYGEDEHNLETMSYFYDLASASRTYDGKLLPNLTEDIYHELHYARGAQYLEQKYPTKFFRKFYTDKMARETIRVMKAKINGDKDHTMIKFYGFSGHESNIMPFMDGYDLMSASCQLEKLEALQNGKTIDETKLGCLYDAPVFAANFIWELSQGADKEYYVKTTYNGKAVISENLCNSFVDTVYCKFDDFEEKMELNFYADGGYDSHCTAANKDEDDDFKPPLIKSWLILCMIMAAFIALLMIILLLLCCMLMRQSAQSKDNLLDR